MIKWNKYSERIPSQVQIGNNRYKVYYIDQFPYDEKQEGEMDANLKQIVIRKGQSNKETFGTYIHECLHAFSYEYGINLTESQVSKLEQTIHYWLKDNNLLKGKKSESETRQRKRRNTKKVRSPRKKA